MPPAGCHNNVDNRSQPYHNQPLRQLPQQQPERRHHHRSHPGGMPAARNHAEVSAMSPPPHFYNQKPYIPCGGPTGCGGRATEVNGLAMGTASGVAGNRIGSNSLPQPELAAGRAGVLCSEEVMQWAKERAKRSCESLKLAAGVDVLRLKALKSMGGRKVRW